MLAKPSCLGKSVPPGVEGILTSFPGVQPRANLLGCSPDEEDDSACFTRSSSGEERLGGSRGSKISRSPEVGTAAKGLLKELDTASEGTGSIRQPFFVNDKGICKDLP